LEYTRYKSVVDTHGTKVIFVARMVVGDSDNPNGGFFPVRPIPHATQLLG